LIVCHPVITEACFLLPYAVQRQRLISFISAFAVVTYSTEDESSLWREVFEWLERYREHEPDWADGYLAVVAGRERRFKLWTYDEEFHQVWRRLDGTRIPLAVRS
jgi:predicted nucleic acid-binding protein